MIRTDDSPPWLNRAQISLSSVLGIGRVQLTTPLILWSLTLHMSAWLSAQQRPMGSLWRFLELFQEQLLPPWNFTSQHTATSVSPNFISFWLSGLSLGSPSIHPPSSIFRQKSVSIIVVPLFPFFQGSQSYQILMSENSNFLFFVPFSSI